MRYIQSYLAIRLEVHYELWYKDWCDGSQVLAITNLMSSEVYWAVIGGNDGACVYGSDDWYVTNLDLKQDTETYILVHILHVAIKHQCYPSQSNANHLMRPNESQQLSNLLLIHFRMVQTISSYF
jgi:hypothetical protein